MSLDKKNLIGKDEKTLHFRAADLADFTIEYGKQLSD